MWFAWYDYIREHNGINSIWKIVLPLVNCLGGLYWNTKMHQRFINSIHILIHNKNYFPHTYRVYTVHLTYIPNHRSILWCLKIAICINKVNTLTVRRLPLLLGYIFPSCLSSVEPRVFKFVIFGKKQKLDTEHRRSSDRPSAYLELTWHIFHIQLYPFHSKKHTLHKPCYTNVYQWRKS